MTSRSKCRSTVGQRRGNAPRLEDLGIGRINQAGAADRGHPHHDLTLGVPDLRQHALSELRGTRAESVRDTVPVHQVAYRVRPPGVLGGDDDNLTEDSPARCVTILHELSNGSVKQLVGRRPGLEYVVADVADSNAAQDLLRRLGMSPRTPSAQAVPAGRWGAEPLLCSKISARASSGNESSTKTTAILSCRCRAPCSVLMASSGASSPEPGNPRRTRVAVPPRSCLVDADPHRPPRAAACHPSPPRP